MNIEKSRISPLQFMFAIMCFIRSSSLLSSFFTPIVNQDSWLVIIFGMIVSLPVLWIYISLSKAFPKSNLIEINDLVFGRIGGKIISAFYLWFFFTLTALNLRDLGIFVGKSTMSKTPPVLIIIVFILLCAWAVYYGLEVVTRYGIVFILISSAILLLSFLVSVNIMHRESFLPILNQPLKSYIQGTNIITMIPFGELVVFLMIVPYVDFKQKKLVRYFMGGFLLGGLLLLAVILRDLAILGNTLKYFSLPSFETLRIIRLFDSLGHMEILFAILLIILLFFKVTLLFYISLLALSYWLKIETFRPFILPVAALLVAYSFIMFESSMQQTAFAREIIPFFWPIFEMLLPFITLIVAYIRELPKKNREKEKEDVKV